MKSIAVKNRKTTPAYGEVATKDIFHTAYLVTCGMQIKDIRHDVNAGREKVIFILHGDGIAGYEEAYRMGLVNVNLFAFKESVKRVKDAMFGFIRSRGIGSGSY